MNPADQRLAGPSFPSAPVPRFHRVSGGQLSMTGICTDSVVAGVGRQTPGSKADVADTATTCSGARTHFAPSTDKIPACARIHR